ncbi:Retrovirus-related Pol polyprotein from type-1 retrotransposable element R1 4 [Amphibalanus amphitrite]|uniref:Retrovirus-related Pol polyprotein from type-1 retrotransposable element R1 4 n=1 Tax=Amphibalanus amphitrite TaxID=1232801 RepID=A0A6A4VPJ4_AMPAM|nr:Retrovirus-related Pol polyprotein from type-1 retrotransposable element R1 4 [Amphibalanus amphitrite]
MYADDTATLCAGASIETARHRAQQAADTLTRWARTSKMVVSGEKTQVLVLSQWPKDAVDLSIRVAGARVEARETLNLLGVTLDRLLHFGPHCKRMRQRTRPRLQHLRRLTGRDWGLEERQLRIVANGYVRGALEHAAAAWLPASSPSHVEVLEREMREAARVITGCTRSTPTEALMAEAGLAPVTARKTTLAARFLAKARALPEEDPLRRVADATVNPRLKAVTGWRTVGLEAWHMAGVVAPIEPVLPPRGRRPPRWSLTWG